MCAVVEQHLHNRDPIVAGSEVQGSTMPAVQVAYINEARLRREDGAHTLYVSSSCSLRREGGVKGGY